jgi:phage terminase large subunit GpA-like protein
LSIWTDKEREAWRPNKHRNLADWAEANFQLPLTSPEPGPIRLHRTPYLRAPLNAISDSSVREITYVGGTQISKTTLELILIGWLVDRHPAEALFLMGRDEDATSISVDRARPCIEASPALARHLTSSRNITKSKISINGARIYFDTANSAAAVASKPIEFFMADELHLHPFTIKGQGPPYDLGKKRVSNYPLGKIIGTSTLTTPDMIGWRLYEQGTRHEWCMGCPSCSALIPYEFSNVKWPEDERNPARIRDLRLAWYECPQCSHKISELEKERALLSGDYLAKNQTSERPSHVSYWVSGMASAWRTWSGIAAEFLQCYSDPEKLRMFHNTILGVNWEESIARVDKKSVHILSIGAPKRKELPNEAQILTAGIDCHGLQKGFYFSIWAWAHGGRRWMVDYGRAHSEEEIIAAIDGPHWKTQDGIEFSVFVGVDSGWGATAPEIYEMVRPLYPRWRATKGFDELIGMKVSDSAIDYFQRKQGLRPLAAPMQLLKIDTNFFKDELAGILATSTNSAESRIQLCDPLSEEFVLSLTSEHKVKRGGKSVWVKKYAGAPNHYWDTAIIARAVAERHGLQRLPNMENMPAIHSRPMVQPQRNSPFSSYAQMRR